MEAEYLHDDFFIALVGKMLEGAFEVPCHKTVFGIPLTYNRRAIKQQMSVWEYTLSSEAWSLTMTTSWNSEMVWKATGDLEAARRDLSLLKIAVS